MQDFQIQSFQIAEKLDKFLHSKRNKEEELESELIFLGWMSARWTKRDCKKADKWLKAAIAESVKFFVQSWEERNEWIVAKENERDILMQRFKEICENKSNYDDEMIKWIDDVMSEKTNLTTRQLKIKLEITRAKMKDMRTRMKESKQGTHNRIDDFLCEQE